MFGDLLFSFIVEGIMLFVVYFKMWVFIGVELVKVIFVICLLVVSVLFVFLLKLFIMFSMFGGSRLLMIFIRIRIDVGVCLVGFSMI